MTKTWMRKGGSGEGVEGDEVLQKTEGDEGDNQDKEEEDKNQNQNQLAAALVLVYIRKLLKRPGNEKLAAKHHRTVKTNALV